MIRAAIIGMGSWGQNLVNSVQGKSAVIRFVAGATRTPSKAADFAAKHDIRLMESYEHVLGDASIDKLARKCVQRLAEFKSGECRVHPFGTKLLADLARR